MQQDLDLLKKELNEELSGILQYWYDHTIDHQFGGFHGRINHQNEVVEKANKGIILNTRILWSFAATTNYRKTEIYREMADRSYQYLCNYFLDKEHGGLLWDLNYKGQVINSRKQVYAQAFGIFAFSEYYKCSGEEASKSLAIQLFELVEQHSKDQTKGGYLEAFERDWSTMEDMRLSRKDMNASKTMNTHLHVLEAYTSLLTIYDNSELKSSLKELVRLFLDRFLNRSNYHYHLFFDYDWQLQSNIISYGHDIETAWLVLDAAKALKDQPLIEESEKVALKVINAFLDEALDTEGAVMNEKNLKTGEIDTDRHWWPQVEAMIGLTMAFQKTSDNNYLNKCLTIWEFVKKHLRDQQHGEWHFRVDHQGKAYDVEDKVSMWKAPYHTSRACIMLNTL